MNPANPFRCAECRYPALGTAFVANKGCPRCGSTLLLDPDQDLVLMGQDSGDGQGGVWIRLNWQEFRILATWARFWADLKNQENPQQWGWMLRVVDAITYQIKKAAPGAPLTVADDAVIAKQQNPGLEVKARRPDGSEVQLEPTWLNSEITRPEPPAPRKE